MSFLDSLTVMGDDGQSMPFTAFTYKQVDDKVFVDFSLSSIEERNQILEQVFLAVKPLAWKINGLTLQVTYSTLTESVVC